MPSVPRSSHAKRYPYLIPLRLSCFGPKNPTFENRSHALRMLIITFTFGQHNLKSVHRATFRPQTDYHFFRRMPPFSETVAENSSPPEGTITFGVQTRVPVSRQKIIKKFKNDQKGLNAMQGWSIRCSSRPLLSQNETVQATKIYGGMLAIGCRWVSDTGPYPLNT